MKNYFWQPKVIDGFWDHKIKQSADSINFFPPKNVARMLVQPDSKEERKKMFFANKTSV